MRSPDHLGRLGERTVAAWLAQHDIVANPSSDDRTGFDILVELPTGHPIDGHGSPFKALVQIKTADKARGHLDIALSNWRRLAENPLPAFVVVLDFAGEATPQRAFLVHVWEPEIRSVKERLHKHEQDASRQLHRQTLRVQYDDARHEIAPSSDALVEALLGHVGPTLESYVRAKLDLLDSVGYDHARILARLALVLPEGYDDPADLFVDLALGVVDAIDADSVALHDRRFGTTSERPFRSWPLGGEITIRDRKTEQAVLLFKRTDGLGDLRVPARVRLPHGAKPFITERNLKVLFTTPFAEFVVEPGRRQCSFAFEWPEWDEAHPLDAIGRHAALFLFLHQCREEGAEFVVEPSFSVDGTPVSLSQSEPAPVAELMAEGLPEWLIEEAGAAHAAWTIARAFDVPLDEEVYLGECVEKAQFLQVTADLLGPNPQHSETPFASDDPDTYFQPGETIAIPYVTGFAFGQRGYLIGLGFVGIPERQNEGDDGRIHFVLRTKDIRVVERVVLPRKTESWPTEVLHTRTVRALQSQGLLVLDMGRLSSSPPAPDASPG